LSWRGRGHRLPAPDERLIGFIRSQPVFFVATAPSIDAASGGGHVNVSPMGYRDTFAVLDPMTVAYLDLTGSGAETIAHVRQNGRITIMFCSFDRTPKILRIYGRGKPVLPADRDWAKDGRPAVAPPIASVRTVLLPAINLARRADLLQ
jgi:hypothetical protein